MKALRLQLVLLVVTLVVFELVLQLLARPLEGWLEPVRPWVRDAQLLKRGNPRFPGHDARGYRNPSALEWADVVILGDSHTYGVGVAPEQAWPALVRTRKRATYSMAHAGYGPGQYQRILEAALALHPRLVIVGLYLGNDLYDAYAMDRGAPPPAGLEDLAARAAAADAVSSIQDQAAELWKPAGRQPVREWLGAHVQLYRLAHRVRERLAPSTPATGRNIWIAEGEGWRGVTRIAYRRLGLDRGDPRIQLGFERSVEALTRMATRCRANGATLLVLILPTKESAFFPRVSPAKRSAAFTGVVEDEAWFHDELMRRLREHEIPILDPLPVLRASVTQPYPESVDGHPNPLGHTIIAEMVADWIAEHL